MWAPAVYACQEVYAREEWSAAETAVNIACRTDKARNPPSGT
jgi:hypothetical protein